MLHLYGLIEPHTECSGVGLGGEPLVPIECGRIVAVASEHAEPLDSTPAEDALWEHEGVLEALLESGSVLPVRFGVRFADRRALRVELEPRSTQLAEALAHVRGRVELSVRLLAREDIAPRTPSGVNTEAGPGTRHLLEKLEARREASRKLDAVRSRLAPLAIAERSQLLPRGGALAAAAFLVERSGLDRFRAEVRKLERELEDVVLVCTGPWPPYNFVDEPSNWAA